MDNLPERENFTIDVSGGKVPQEGAPAKK